MAWARTLAWQFPMTAMEGPVRGGARRDLSRHAVAQEGADREKAWRARLGRSVRATMRAGLERKAVEA